MQNDLMKKTTVLCSLFVAAAMGVMLWFCTNKIVVVADVAQDEVVPFMSKTVSTATARR